MEIAPIVTKNSSAAVALVDNNADKIAAILPKGTDVRRYIGVMQAEINRNPDLATCHPATLVGSMIHCARLGLEPGLMNKIHLVPFFNKKKNSKECQVIVGYDGLIDLALRTKEISQIQSQIVYSNDEFSASLGGESSLIHRPKFFSDRGEIVGAYAIAWFADGSQKFEIMTIDEIKAIQSKSKSGYIWSDHFGEMARKTAVRRLCKHLPKTAELDRALTLENLADSDAGQAPDQILADAGIRYEAPLTIPETNDFEAKKEKVIAELLNLDDDTLARAFPGLPLATVIDKLTDAKKCEQAMLRIAAAVKV